MVDSVLVSDITERVRVRVDACKLSVSKTSAMHQALCAKKKIGTAIAALDTLLDNIAS